MIFDLISEVTWLPMTNFALVKELIYELQVNWSFKVEHATTWESRSDPTGLSHVKMYFPCRQSVQWFRRTVSQQTTRNVDV